MMPDEFAEFAKQIGMRLVESAGDAGLCKAKNVNPIYDPKFNGHDPSGSVFVERVNSKLLNFWVLSSAH